MAYEPNQVDEWRLLVNTIVKLRVQNRARYFLISYGTISYSRSNMYEYIRVNLFQHALLSYATKPGSLAL
jgi:hypothetical protein